jgi:hypothetical protein
LHAFCKLICTHGHALHSAYNSNTGWQLSLCARVFFFGQEIETVISQSHIATYTHGMAYLHGMDRHSGHTQQHPPPVHATLHAQQHQRPPLVHARTTQFRVHLNMIIRSRHATYQRSRQLTHAHLRALPSSDLSAPLLSDGKAGVARRRLLQLCLGVPR